MHQYRAERESVARAPSVRSLAVASPPARGGPTTVLSGQGVRNVIGGLVLTAQARFENLVITNGRGDYGGGVSLSGASPVFQNCRFVNDVATWQGGAMLLTNVSRPTLINCEISGNSVSNAQGQPGGSSGAVSIGNGSLTLVGNQTFGGDDQRCD